MNEINCFTLVKDQMKVTKIIDKKYPNVAMRARNDIMVDEFS